MALYMRIASALPMHNAYQATRVYMQSARCTFGRGAAADAVGPPYPCYTESGPFRIRTKFIAESAYIDDQVLARDDCG